MGMGLALCRSLVQKSCRGMARGWLGCCPRLVSDREAVSDEGAARMDRHASGREVDSKMWSSAVLLLRSACPPSAACGVRGTCRGACVGEEERRSASHSVAEVAGREAGPSGCEVLAGVDGDLVFVVSEAVEGADGGKEGVEVRGSGLESGVGEMTKGTGLLTRFVVQYSMRTGGGGCWERRKEWEEGFAGEAEVLCGGSVRECA
eukprot:2229227-Rhodomonas_salina.1